MWKRAILAEAGGGEGCDCDSAETAARLLVARDDICRTRVPARDARLGRLFVLAFAFVFSPFLAVAAPAAPTFRLELLAKSASDCVWSLSEQNCRVTIAFVFLLFEVGM